MNFSLQHFFRSTLRSSRSSTPLVPLVANLVISLASALVLLLGTLACAQKGVQGVWFSQSQIAQLKVGEQKQKEVVALLGPPNLVNPYRPHIYYYYGARTKQVGQISPALSDRQVLILLFARDGGVLEALELRNIDKVRFVRTDADKTRGLRSAKRNLLQDIFGNIKQVGIGSAQ